MSDLCERIDALLDAGAGGEGAPSDALPPGLADHAAHCPTCSGRLEAERLLARTLGAPDLPRLSADFTPRLLDRLEREARRGRRARRFLGAYWLAAALIAGLVLSGSDLPGALPGAAWVPLLFTAAGLLAPALAFLRRWLRTPGLSARL